MLTEIEEFRLADGHRIEVRFEDGIRGAVDLSELVGLGVFAPLRDPALFAQVTLDEFAALCWPNGADLAPDAVHEALLRDGHWRPILTDTAMPA